MYKILFTDIDGTLLNKERMITHDTKLEIHRINFELGIPVILISSRMPKAMKHLHYDLRLNDPVIPYNGALILNSPEITGESSIMFSRTITPEIVKSIIGYKNGRNFHISLYFNNNWYVEEMDYWANREVSSTKVTPSVIRHEAVIKDLEEKNIGAHKVMCMGEEAEIDGLSDWLNTEYSEKVSLYRSKPTFLEITPNIVSKATAIEYLLNHLGLELSESVAVGDNYNDLEMLQKAGLGIAMGNAPDSVKKAADYTTLSNSEDGLAAALKIFFNSFRD